MEEKARGNKGEEMGEKEEGEETGPTRRKEGREREK